jgi:putative transposase
VWEQALERFDAVSLAYCLMDNHYHFVLETRRANLSRLMRHVNGVYTQRYNGRHKQIGHLFQGRFKAILVDRDAYFLEVCRYVELNPVRAQLVRRPQDWRWSSYRTHVGLQEPPSWLDSDRLLRSFSARDGVAMRRYAEFVAQGKNVRLWEQALAGQIFLGNEDFIDQVRAKGAAKPDSREIPRAHRKRRGKSLSSYIKIKRGSGHNAGIVAAYLHGGHTQTAIAGAIGLSVSRVSRLIKAHEAKGKT